MNVRKERLSLVLLCGDLSTHTAPAWSFLASLPLGGTAPPRLDGALARYPRPDYELPWNGFITTT